MSIKLGIVGAGAFAQCFIPLFKAHPQVAQVSLADLDPKKLAENAQRWGIQRTYPSMDKMLETDVDAVAIITQHWLHAPQAIQALKAGKHVYSAVPTGVNMEEIKALARTVEETRKVYMIGETSYYYPAAVYCRKQMAEGAFGHIVFGEAEYYHDIDHGLMEVLRWRCASLGLDPRKQGGDPPMYYPTHSTSMIISVTGAHMTHVSCQGFVDREPDTLYDPAVNIWKNAFSNEAALFRMSDGSAARINEFRRVGHPGTVRMTLFGTLGSFEQNAGAQHWLTKGHGNRQSLDDLLECRGVPEKEVQARGAQMAKVTGSDGTHLEAARIHDLARLPKEFIGLPNGHAGSHQFLVDDFVTACANKTLPPNNIWQAARYAIPGVIAHDSALQGGKLLEVPDLGDAPKGFAAR